MAVHIPSRQKVSLAAMAGVARAAAPTAGAIRTPLTPALRCQLRTTNALAPIASTIGMSRSASTAASAPASSNVPDDVLTWDRFFNLRQRRRWVNLASSLGTSVTTIAIAGPILAQQDIDTWAAQLSGIDPIFVLGIATLSVGAGGWLLGPTIGTQIFKMMIGKKGWQKEIAAVRGTTFFASQSPQLTPCCRRKSPFMIGLSGIEQIPLRPVPKIPFLITTARKLAA